MSKQETREGRQVRKCARPIDIRKDRSRVVLCLHGFTGYPGEMAWPAARLDEAGWDVRIPRLTGHGTDGDDFSGVRMKDIIRQVRDEWLNLKASYERVCVLGHSMGGLLTLDLAREYPVERAAVMAPAIGIRAPGQNLLGPLSLFVRKRPIKWEADPRYTFYDDRDEDDDAFLGREYWSWAWIRQISELQAVMKRNERQLGRISTPVLGIFGSKDNLVGQLGRPILERSLAGEFAALQLENSGHYIPYEYTAGVKEAALEAVIDWFGRT